MTQNLRLRVGCARSIKGQSVSSTPIAFPLVWDRKTRAALCRSEKLRPIFSPCLHAAGHLVYPFRGQPNAGRFTQQRKVRPFPLPAHLWGQMTQNLRLRVGYARSIKGQSVSSIACSLSPCMGQKNMGRFMRQGKAKGFSSHLHAAGHFVHPLSGSAKPGPYLTPLYAQTSFYPRCCSARWACRSACSKMAL